MKEEIIKKIKKCLIAGYDVDVINQEEIGILWNYITNLQEENKDLKYSNIYLSKTCDRYKITVENYKSKIDKAIEYITNYEYKTVMQEIALMDDFKNLLNILQGEDKE